MQLVPNPTSYIYNQSNSDFIEKTYLSSTNKSLPPRVHILGAKNIYSVKVASERALGPVSTKRRSKFGNELSI